MNKYFNANAAFVIFAREYLELKKNLPIRPSEMGVLNIITVTEGLYTPVMLAEMLHVSKPMVTAYLSSLSSKGYITKQCSETDKRAYYIIPTEKAKELVEKTRIDMEKQLNWLMQGMGEEDFENFIRLAGIATKIIKKNKIE